MYTEILNLTCTSFSLLIIAIIVISKKYTVNNKIILFLLINVIISRVLILNNSLTINLSLSLLGSKYSLIGETLQSIYTILVPSVNFAYVVYLSKNKGIAIKYFYKTFGILSIALIFETLVIKGLNFPITFVLMFSIWISTFFNVLRELKVNYNNYKLTFVYFLLINVFGITIIGLFSVLTAFQLETKNQMLIFMEYQLLSDFIWMIFLVFILLNLEIILKIKNEFKFKKTINEFGILQLLFLNKEGILTINEKKTISKISEIERSVINGIEGLSVLDSLYSLSQRINEKTINIKNIFNKVSNTFNDYKNRILIKRSEVLISEGYLTHRSVEQLASELGFNNRVTFYKNFKKYTGSVPTKIKKNQ